MVLDSEENDKIYNISFDKANRKLAKRRFHVITRLKIIFFVRDLCLDANQWSVESREDSLLSLTKSEETIYLLPND